MTPYFAAYAAHSLEERHHPFQNLVEGVAFGSFGTGEDPDHGRTELGGDLDPVLHQLHVFAAGLGIGHGEIVAHAGAAESDAVQKGAPLQAVNVLVRRDLGVTGEVVPGRVNGLDAVFGAVIDHVRQRHTAVAQRGVERISVEAQFDADAGDPGDAALGECCRGGQNERAEKDAPAGVVGGHDNNFMRFS